ncbi:hypothetical protein CJP72_21070 [Citrobacter sp. NCU1]|nr:hypothetical protein [Citrobacter sp. NCU1]
MGYATEAKQEDKDAKRIEELKETISLLKGDLAYCQTRQQVANVYALIDSREAELVAPRGAQDETQGNTEQAFINRCVSALDAAGMAEHNVYICWFRINYGCWINASDVVEAGGLAQYLKSIGLNESDVTELMTQDCDCQDAEGLALKCLGNYGSFDWKLMGELLEAAEECGEDVVDAALSAGIPATEAGNKYLGQWESMEDYAYDQWESCGLLESIPEAARGYLDWEAIARDIQFNGDVCESNGHYFCAC